MSLNHKRRIFGPSTNSLSSRKRRLPSLGLALAATGCVAGLVATGLRFFQFPQVPARALTGGMIFAPADLLAVLDGDTLRVGDQVVRLEGISAPLRGSVCHDAGQLNVDCGSAAAEALASLVRGGSMGCAIRGLDDQGRPIGDCTVSGVRLNEAMVQNGWARAQAADLRNLEAAARGAGRGIWHGNQ